MSSFKSLECEWKGRYGRYCARVSGVLLADTFLLVVFYRSSRSVNTTYYGGSGGARQPSPSTPPPPSAPRTRVRLATQVQDRVGWVGENRGADAHKAFGKGHRSGRNDGECGLLDQAGWAPSVTRVMPIVQEDFFASIIHRSTEAMHIYVHTCISTS